MRPDEMVGPEDSEGSAIRSEFRMTNDHGVENSEFEAADEVHETFPVEPIPVVMAPDGLPTIVTPDPQQTQAIAFTYETVICVEDDREYVELWTDEIRSIVGIKWTNPAMPDKIVENPNLFFSYRDRYDGDGVEHARRTFEPKEVESRWGMDLVKVDGDKWLPVRPLRPQCKHYRRQVFSNDDQPDSTLPGHQIVFRVCAARRSNGGAHMSLRDEGIYQCDFRDPPDPKTALVQDEKDRFKLQNRPDLLHLPLFGMPGDAVQISKEKELS